MCTKELKLARYSSVHENMNSIDQNFEGGLEVGVGVYLWCLFVFSYDLMNQAK
jgi:hypothetical protein